MTFFLLQPAGMPGSVTGTAWTPTEIPSRHASSLIQQETEHTMRHQPRPLRLTRRPISRRNLNLPSVRLGRILNTVYFFRAYDVTNARPVPTDIGASYPSLSTEGATLSVVVAGIDNGILDRGCRHDRHLNSNIYSVWETCHRGNVDARPAHYRINQCTLVDIRPMFAKSTHSGVNLMM